jgi:aspartate/methionine/tyrosine aminotransferase
LATLAMQHRATLRDRNRGLVRKHLALLQAFLARHPERFGPVAPVAGPLAFPALLGPESDEAFAERAASEAGVLVVPGSTFERPGHLRIGFGRANFPEALACFEAFVAGHRQESDRS